MKILLDTHIFLWSINEDKKLSKKIRSRILEASEIYISSASIWEISIKLQLDRLKGDIDEIVASISESGFKQLPITAQHVLQVSKLPPIHRDPFDRMLVAQAISEPLILVTVDEQLKKYSTLIEIIV
jgi:PIN domain nuclease of toxin-antitoxin system